MVKELALPQGIGGLMSIDIGKPSDGSPQSVGIKEKAPRKEREPKTLDFFGWDVDGTCVDTMDHFRSINVGITTTHYGRYGLTRDVAEIEYDADPSATGTRFVEDMGRIYRVPERVIRRAVLEVRERLSKQLGNPMPHVAEIMAKLKEKHKKQFVLTNANRKDAIRKLEHAGLMRYLDPKAVVGANSGKPGETLLKGEPQLRKAAGYYMSQGRTDSYEDFTWRAGYFADMVRDMKEMIPCNLGLLIAFADKAATIDEMNEVGKILPLDRFRVVTARSIQDILGYIEIIDRQVLSR